MIVRNLSIFFLVSFVFLYNHVVSGQQPANIQTQGATPSRTGGNNGRLQSFGVVSGAVHDESTKDHVQYASALLYKVKDSLLLTGAITDAKGRFLINNIAPGRYYLKIRFIGYDDKIVGGINISQQTADIKLDDIVIKPSASSLDGVVVSAQRSVVSSNLDKKVITVDKTMALSGGTAADVMENIPSASVDAEGNVSLRGNPNITLLIDGKPASQAGISSSDILNQLPASAIESIEVITNPSVKYDPDGTSGIINIVLKKKALQGFNGQVSGTVGTNDKYNGSLNLNFRHNKINLYGGADARYNRNFTSYENIRTSTIAEEVNILRQNQDGTRTHNSLNLNAGIDYALNTRNVLSFSVQHRNMSFGQEGNMIYKNYDARDSLLRYFERYSSSDRSISSMGYTLSYKRTFAQKEREFTNDIIYNSNSMDGDQYIDQQNYNSISLTKEGDPQKQHNLSTNDNNFLTVQGNYIHPFANGARIETGYKVSLRDLAMDYTYSNFNNLTSLWEKLDNLDNKYNYKEQIYALYGIYSNAWKKLRYQGGLRFEQVYTDSKVKQNDIKFNRNYTSLYPSLHFQYELSKEREIQLSYSRRVERPSPREMNPYVDYSDSLNIRKGNPNLKPEYSNSLELGFMKYWPKSSLSSTAFYRQTSGNVEDITRLDANGVSTEMPQNINNSQSYGFEFVVSANPYKWMRINSNLSFYRSVVSAIVEENIPGADRFSYSARVNANLNYSKDGSVQLIANYMSPHNTIQEKEEGNFTMDVSLRQDLFKNKVSLTIRATDIFNTRNHNSTITGPNFTSVNKRRMESRVLYAGFQFRINNYSKKTEKDPSNGNQENMDEF